MAGRREGSGGAITQVLFGRVGVLREVAERQACFSRVRESGQRGAARGSNQRKAKLRRHVSRENGGVWEGRAVHLSEMGR